VTISYGAHAQTKQALCLQPLICSLVRRLKRPLSLRRDPRQMPPLPILPVNQRRVLRHPVIPNYHGPLLPLDARLEVGAVRKMVVQELENRIRLLLFEADNVARDCNLLAFFYTNYEER
jgi:hypothetical protein